MIDITKEKPPKIGRYLTYNPTSAFNKFTCSDWCGEAWEADIFNNHKKYVIPRTFITHWDYLPEEPVIGLSATTPPPKRQSKNYEN